MQIQQLDTKEERRILIGLITNKNVLARINTRYEQNMFASPWANLVASWCIKFWNNYQKAPQAEIESIYDRWASKKSRDKATRDLVGKFLQGLSEEYDRGDGVNVDYLIDRAATYFNKVKLQRLSETIKEQIEDNKVETAEELVKAHRSVDLGAEAFTDPYTQTDIHERAFGYQVEQLVEYPGPAGDFFREQLARDCFFVFQAPMKRQKSFLLFDLVHRSLMQRRRVCYFQVGDMSENQVVRRQQVRLCERPRKHGKWQFPTRVSLRGGKVRVTKEEKLARRDLTLADVVRAQQAFRDYYLRSDKPFLRMQCQARNSVDGIVSRLDRLRDDEDFIPDVIVIDYVDLLDAPKGIREKRDQINENWRALRELSLKQHCLVVTATQSNAKAHKLEKQGRSSFSDNQLKQAHVTAMVGINSNSIEIVENVSRLEYIVVREGPHREGFQVGIVSCLEIASPIVRSCYVK